MGYYCPRRNIVSIYRSREFACLFVQRLEADNMFSLFAIEVYEYVQGIFCVAFVHCSVVVTGDRKILFNSFLVSIFVCNGFFTKLIPLRNVVACVRECLEVELGALLYLFGSLYLLARFHHRAGYIAKVWLLTFKENKVSFLLCLQRNGYVQSLGDVVDRPYFAIDGR